MSRLIGRLVPLLQLTRIALVFTAISNIWLVVAISRTLEAKNPALTTLAIRDMPLWSLLICTAAVAAGLYVFGMTLNDLLDQRRDQLTAPHRPLVTGRVSPMIALLITLLALLVAISASIMLGERSALLCLITAGLIIFYNALAKHLPGVGILTLGMIRATHMLIANPALAFCWPIWLTMSHVIGISAAGYRLEGKTPRLTGKHLWLLTGGWAFLSLALISWIRHRGELASQTPLSHLWIIPLFAVSFFLVLAMRSAHRATTDREAGDRVIKLGLLWLIPLDAAWLLGFGAWFWAAAILCLLPATLLTMSATRFLANLAEDPNRFLSDA